MSKPLQGGIAKQVYKAMKAAKMTLSATLVKVTAGTRMPGSISAGTNPTEVNHVCRGIIDVLSVNDIPATLIQENDRKILLFGASLPSTVIPAPQDKVTIRDLDGTTKTFRLLTSIAGDAAGATYEFQARLT